MVQHTLETSDADSKPTACRSDADRSAELLGMISELNELRMRLDLLLAKIARASDAGDSGRTDGRRVWAAAAFDRVRDKLVQLLGPSR
ncbi:MAG: hypothetical protein D6760_02920 [Deltaproteobacteria bacterium]|nr:MAG: hypothetical protein D6760_02920 [Deltaproteobacteria bacterium]